MLHLYFKALCDSIEVGDRELGILEIKIVSGRSLELSKIRINRMVTLSANVTPKIHLQDTGLGTGAITD